jgi:hypothetical protein
VDAVGEANFPGSARTARRRVKETDLRCRSAAKKILLTQQHKERRVGFALEYMAVDETFWDNIIFTDEKTFPIENVWGLLVKKYKGKISDP